MINWGYTTKANQNGAGKKKGNSLSFCLRNRRPAAFSSRPDCYLL